MSASSSSGVIVVDTPHQVINAIEACVQLNVDEAYIVVILSEEYSESAFKPMVDEYCWESVFWVRMHTRLMSLRQRFDRVQTIVQALRSRALRRIAKKIGHVEIVFLGNYLAAYMRHFAAVLTRRQIVLLDDGTSTIKINNQLVKYGYVEQVKGYDRSASLARRLGNRIIDFEDTVSVPVTFFSTYELSTRSCDRLVKNEYRYLKEKNSKSQLGGEIFFLGMTLVEDGLMSKDAYLSEVRAVVGRMLPNRIVYIPHKREASANLANIKAKLEIEIRRIDVPVEYYIASSEFRPKVVVSFFSSALETCRTIFGDRISVRFCYIDFDSIIQERGFVRDVYEAYQRQATSNFKELES